MKPFDEHGRFRAVPDARELRQVAVRSAGAAFLSQAITFVVQIGATVVLARILTPDDFGVVAMVTAFSMLLQNLGLNGFTEAIIQRPELDHALASNVFWVNLALSVVLAAAFAASGPALAALYGDDRVIGVAAVVSLAMVATGLCVLHLALLKRAMRFRHIALNDIVCQSTSILVAIGLGWAGWGYWALAVAIVVLPLTSALLAWGACRWVPGLPRPAAGMGGTLGFATATYGRFALNYGMRNIDNLLIGSRFGAQSLGVYKKAYDLFVLPINQLSGSLTGVVVSTLSRLADDPERRERYFLRTVATLAFVGMGLAADLTVVGADVVRLLLGPQWDASGHLFTIFAPAVGIALLHTTQGWLHLAIGRPDRWLRSGLVELAFTALLLVAALAWGPPGMAAAWVVSLWLLAAPVLWYAGRPADIALTRIVDATWRYIAAAAVAGAATSVLLHELDGASAEGVIVAAARVLGGSLVFSVLYVCAVGALHGGWEPIRHIARIVRDMAVLRTAERVGR